MRSIRLLAGFFLLLFLAACGGGGGGGPAAPAVAAIVAQPASVTVTAGASATFSVTASGDGLSYQWQRNGTDVSGATAASYVVNPVSLDDDGSRWTVVVKNAATSVTSNAAVLSVKPPPGISLVAGALGGLGNVDGPGGRFQTACALAVDKAGIIYVNDSYAIRTLTPDGKGGAVAATLFAAQDYCHIALDGNGNLAAIAGNRIVRLSSTGVESTLAGAADGGFVDGVGAAARFSRPTALAYDQAGNLYVADNGNTSIRMITPAGVVSTHSASKSLRRPYPSPASLGETSYYDVWVNGIALDGAGNIYVAGKDFGQVDVIKVAPDGTDTVINMNNDGSVVSDKSGNLYSFSQHVLYKAAPDGTVVALAGKLAQAGAADGTGEQARLGVDPYLYSNVSLGIDNDGNVLLGDPAAGTIRKITPAGVVTTIGGKAEDKGLVDGAGAAARFDGGSHLGIDAQGQIYVRQGAVVRKVTRSGMVTTLNLPSVDKGNVAINYFPEGLAFNGSIIAVANGVISRVDAGGNLVAIAGKAGGGTRVDGTGDQAVFNTIDSLARDGQGNLYVVDSVYTRYPDGTFISDTAVRKITPSGVVSTVMSRTPDMGFFQAVAADKDGNLAVSTSGSLLYRITAAGTQSSLTGSLSFVGGLVLDNAGNLYLGSGSYSPSDLYVDKLAPNGDVTHIAGKSGSRGVMLGSLPGSLNTVTGMTMDQDGVIYVMSENALLRIVR